MPTQSRPPGEGTNAFPDAGPECAEARLSGHVICEVYRIVDGHGARRVQHRMSPRHRVQVYLKTEQNYKKLEIRILPNAGVNQEPRRPSDGPGRGISTGGPEHSLAVGHLALVDPCTKGLLGFV